MSPDKRNEWLIKVDEECPYHRQVRHSWRRERRVLRYCFVDPDDAAAFRAQFERKSERLSWLGERLCFSPCADVYDSRPTMGTKIRLKFYAPSPAPNIPAS